MGKYLLIALAIGGVVGCGSDGGLVSGQSDDVAAKRPNANTAPALFRDPATSGVRLDVFDFGGNVAVSVSAPIGTEIPATRPNATLTEVYRALHPDASSIPTELGALDLRIAPLLKKIVVSSDAASTAIQGKSVSAFQSRVCVDQAVDNFSYYHPVLCSWGKANPATDENELFLSTMGNFAAVVVQPGDHVYGWNNTNSPATLGWVANEFTTAEYGEIFDFAPYTYNWTTVVSGGPYGCTIGTRDDITLPAHPTVGDLGISRHVFLSTPH